MLKKSYLCARFAKRLTNKQFFGDKQKPPFDTMRTKIPLIYPAIAGGYRSPLFSCPVLPALMYV